MNALDVRYWRERCEELEEELRQLKDSHNQSLVYTSHMINVSTGVTGLKCYMLAWMYTNYPRVLRKDNDTSDIMEYLRSFVPSITKQDSQSKTADVLICKLRDAIESQGGERNFIVTIHSEGHALSPQGRDWIKQKIEDYVSKSKMDWSSEHAVLSDS